jgi:bacteriocin biosynthesis cyclodehydratase domain-containing protein
VVTAVVGPQERLKIADHFRVLPVGIGEFRLHSLTSSFILKSQAPDLLERLFPLLDGARTVQEVLDELASFGQEAVHDSLQRLVEGNVLELADQRGTGILLPEEGRRFRRQIAFFSHFVAPFDTGTNCSPVGELPRKGIEFQEYLRRARVIIFGMGRLGSQLVRSLAVAGVGTITAVDSETLVEDDLANDAGFTAQLLGVNRAEATGRMLGEFDATLTFRAVPEPINHAALLQLLSDYNFAVLCPDIYDPNDYEEFNRAAMAAKITWTSARLAGFEFHVGPTVIPGQTSCYECLRLRVNSNVLDYDEHVLLENSRKHSKLPEEALAITPGAGLLALEVVKALTWFTPPATCSHLYSLNLLTLQSELHPILKIPRCPVCGRSAMPRPTIHAWQQTRVDPLS